LFAKLKETEGPSDTAEGMVPQVFLLFVDSRYAAKRTRTVSILTIQTDRGTFY
jgi:hypothetical protein